MKLLLRPDVYRASTGDGLYFLTHHGSVAFEGSSIAAWLDRLEPFLDGRFGIDDLSAQLDERHRPMLERVIRALVEADLVREIDDPSAVRTADCPEQRYLNYFRDSAAAEWANYRNADVLVIGSGVLAASVVRACTDSGLKRIHPISAAEWSGELVPDDGIVLHIADGDDHELAGRVAEACTGSGVIVGHVAWLGDRALIGPVGSSVQDWQSAWRRLIGACPYLGDTGTAPGQPVRAPGSVERTVVANQLVQRAFRAYTGIADTAERDRLTSVAYESLRTEQHTFLPHPFTGAPAPATRDVFDAAVRGLREGATIDEETMSQRTAPLVDSMTGIFVEIAQRGFAQFPLHISEAVVSDPVGLAGGPVRVTGAGPDFAGARYRAALRGYAVYGSLALDPRRLPGGMGGDPVELLAGLRSGDTHGLVWGYSLADGRCRQLDAHRAFPALSGAYAGSWPVPGSAAGYSWEGAVRAALLDHCRALALAKLGTEREPLPRVDPEAVELDPLGNRYRALLFATGQQVEIYDLTRLLAVPCYLIRTGGSTVSCAAGESVPGALCSALEQALLAYQATRHEEPAYAPPELPELPENLRGSTSHVPRNCTLASGDLAEALRAEGVDPVAIPLDHDPAVTDRIPYITQVVLEDA